MGVLRDFVAAFKEGYNGDAGSAPKPSTVIRPWGGKPAMKVYRLPADHEAKVYTYDGAPLRGLSLNERFVITAIPGDVTMTSVYTGATASTTNYNDIAYAYNGEVFGFASSHAEAVKKLIMGGYRVEVEAYIRGYDGERGFPYVVGLFGFVDDDLYYSLK